MEVDHRAACPSGTKWISSKSSWVIVGVKTRAEPVHMHSYRNIHSLRHGHEQTR